MNKNEILEKLNELGFTLQEAPGTGYFFKYEEMVVVYMPDEDESFVRFAVPNLYEVTEENRSYLLEIANETNVTIKYGKVCIFGDYVWACAEHHSYGNEDIEELLGHNLSLLNAMVSLFCRLVEGEGMGEDEVTDENEESEGSYEQDV